MREGFTVLSKIDSINVCGNEMIEIVRNHRDEYMRLVQNIEKECVQMETGDKNRDLIQTAKYYRVGCSSSEHNSIEKQRDEIIRSAKEKGYSIVGTSHDMGRNALFGYKRQDDGTLVVDEKEASIVRWIYKMIAEYSDNPPDFLIKEVIAGYEDEDMEIIPEEAKEKVSLYMIQRYIAAEINIRMRQYEDMQGEPEQIQHFLDVQLDETLLVAVEDEYRLCREFSYGISPLSTNKFRIPVGKLVQYSKADSEFKVVGGEPIISEELYESVAAKLKEYQENVPEEDSDISLD